VSCALAKFYVYYGVQSFVTIFNHYNSVQFIYVFKYGDLVWKSNCKEIRDGSGKGFQKIALVEFQCVDQTV